MILFRQLAEGVGGCDQRDFAAGHPITSSGAPVQMLTFLETFYHCIFAHSPVQDCIVDTLHGHAAVGRNGFAARQ